MVNDGEANNEPRHTVNVNILPAMQIFATAVNSLTYIKEIQVPIQFSTTFTNGKILLELIHLK